MVNAIISKEIGCAGVVEIGCLGVVTIVAADCTSLDNLKAYFRLQQPISDNLRMKFNIRQLEYGLGGRKTMTNKESRCI